MVKGTLENSFVSGSSSEVLKPLHGVCHNALSGWAKAFNSPLHSTCGLRMK